MKYLIITAFIIIYFLFGLELGYTPASLWWTHITYNFQHANIMHLLINTVSFFYLFKVLQYHIHPTRIVYTAFLIASATSFFTPYPFFSQFSAHAPPVVGASGMIYAMLGIYLGLIATKKIIFKDVTALIVFLVSIATFLTISLFKSSSAGMLHLICLIAGFTQQAARARLRVHP